VRVLPRHLLEQLVRLRAPALDHEDHRQIGVGLQVLRERRDLTPVGGGRLLRPIEARQQVAAQIVRSLQPQFGARIGVWWRHALLIFQ